MAKSPWERRFSFIAPFSFRVLIVTLRLHQWGGGMEGSVYYLVIQVRIETCLNYATRDILSNFFLTSRTFLP